MRGRFSKRIRSGCEERGKRSSSESDQGWCGAVPSVAQGECLLQRNGFFLYVSLSGLYSLLVLWSVVFLCGLDALAVHSFQRTGQVLCSKIDRDCLVMCGVWCLTALAVTIPHVYMSTCGIPRPKVGCGVFCMV